MTDEEINNEAKKYSQGNFYVEQGFSYGYEVGFAEGEKENTELKEKLRQFEEGETVCIKHYEAIRNYPILKEQIEDWKADHKHNLELMQGLNERIAELKKDKEYLDKVSNEQTEVILQLQQQIAKMKCCENCTKHRENICNEDTKFFARALKFATSDYICKDYEVAR